MRKLIALGALVAFVACTGGAFHETMTFEGNRWQREVPVTFEIEIAESGRYDIFAELSHVYGGIPVGSIPMELSVSGLRLEKIGFDLEIIKDGKQTGDCAGDYCDVSFKITTMDLESGQYKVSVLQKFDHEFLPNIIRAGLSVKKSQ